MSDSRPAFPHTIIYIVCIISFQIIPEGLLQIAVAVSVYIYVEGGAGLASLRHTIVHKMSQNRNVIIAVGDRPNALLADQIQDLCDEVITIGDAQGIGSVLEAVRTGYVAGKTI